MRTIRNRTPRPLKLSLHDDHALHLGPNKTGQLSDRDVERPSVRRAIERGDVELVGDGASSETPVAATADQNARGQPLERRVVLPAGGRTAGGRHTAR